MRVTREDGFGECISDPAAVAEAMRLGDRLRARHCRPSGLRKNQARTLQLTMQLLSQILSARAETIRSVLLRLRVNLLFTAWRFGRRIPTPDGDYPMKKTNFGAGRKHAGRRADRVRLWGLWSAEVT